MISILIGIFGIAINVDNWGTLAWFLQLTIIESVFMSFPVRIFYSSKLLRLFPKSYIGVTIGAWVFFRNRRIDTKKTQEKHEKQHADQYFVFGVFLFLLLYLLNYIYNMMAFKFNNRLAYEEIWFERKARKAEKKLF